MRRQRNAMVLFILLLIIIVLQIQFRAAGPQPEVLAINELADHVARGDIARITVKGNDIEAVFHDGSSAVARKESGKTIAEQLIEFGVPTEQLSSANVQIEVEGEGLLSEADLVLGVVAGGVGVVLGAGLVLLVQKARSSPI